MKATEDVDADGPIVLTRWVERAVGDCVPYKRKEQVPARHRFTGIVDPFLETWRIPFSAAAARKRMVI